MKIKLPQRTNILSTPSEFATLEEIGNQFFNYTVSYNINVSKALAAQGHLVRISIARNPPNAVPPAILTNTDNPSGLAGLSFRQVTNSILTRSASVKDVIRSNQSNYIYTIKSDFTAWIPNDKTAELKIASDSGEPISLQQRRSFIAVQLQSLTDANVRPSILETPLVRPDTVQIIGSNDLQTISSELIHSYGIDPASLLVRQDAISGAEAVHGGVAKAIKRPRNHNQLPQLVGRVVGSLNATGSTKKPSTRNLDKNSMVSQPVMLAIQDIEVKEQFDIPIALLGHAEYYLVFELITMSGTVLQTITNLVDHGKNVAILATPRIPPDLNCVPVSKIGSNLLELTQQDPKAIGVNLYRKQVNTSTVTTSAEYVFVGRIPLTVDDKTVKVEDLVSNFNPIIYRAVPVGKNDSLGAEFSSLVTRGQKVPILFRGKAKHRVKFVSMGYEIDESGIKVELKDIPAGVIAIELFKQDLGSKNPINFVAQPIRTVDRGAGSFYVLDNNVAAGRIYEYSCKLIYKDGAVEDGSNKLLVDYVPEKTNIIETRVLRPRAVQNGAILDIQFDIESNFIDQGEDVLKKILEQQNLISYFSNDVTKEKLQSLVAYGVIRTNITTGDIEEFGIIASSKFSDTDLGVVRGVKPVENGLQYSYAVTTYLRSPTTALAGFTQDVADVRFPAKSYSYQPWSTRHPVTLSEGSTITESSLRRNHAKTQFTFGEVGNITKVFMSLARTMPSIYEAKVTKINSKLTRVQWKIQGTITKIDHFIVILELLGMRTIIGKCHNISETKYFEFLDSLDDGETGEFGYVIIPVYYDYSRGREAVTNKVVIE